MSRKTVRLVGPRQRDYAKQLIDEAPDGYAVAIGEETRTQAQNRLLWPGIKDMQEQIEDMATNSFDDIKLRLLHSLGSELRFLPDLENAGMFPVGQRSSTLSKGQFSALIEIMFLHGARHGVKWSAKALAAYDEVMK